MGEVLRSIRAGMRQGRMDQMVRTREGLEERRWREQDDVRENWRDRELEDEKVKEALLLSVPACNQLSCTWNRTFNLSLKV